MDDSRAVPDLDTRPPPTDSGVEVPAAADATVDLAPRADGVADTPSPDVTVEASSPDATVDASSPDTTVDTGPLPDTTVDSGTPGPVWALSAGGTGNDSAGGIVLDGAGNLYLTGEFQGSIDLGGGPISTAATVGDMFLASFTTGGAHVWSKGFDAVYQLTGNALAIDGSSNLYLAGTLSGTADLGGGELTAIAGFASEVVVASFTANGVHRWSGSYGATNYAKGRDIVTDINGNVTATGTYWGGDFGGGSMGGGAASDCFAASYNASGTYRWAEGFGSGNYDDGYAVAIDAAGNTYLVGMFRGTMTFDGVPLTAGSTDTYLIAANPDGSHRWSMALGGSLPTVGRAVAVDAAGNVTISGSFSETANFGGADLTSAGSTDIYLASYSSTGAHRWSQRLGGTGGDSGLRLRVDATGNLVLAGTFTGTTELGRSLTSAGLLDVFVASFTPAGTFRFADRVGGAGSDGVGGLAVGTGGEVFLSGTFEGDMDLGTQILNSAGGRDLFLLRLR